ncbi:MAG: hypothetical protein R2744_13405 [Bacteroidales bacterium]
MAGTDFDPENIAITGKGVIDESGITGWPIISPLQFRDNQGSENLI